MARIESHPVQDRTTQPPADSHSPNNGLHIARVFCPPDVDPFDTAEWELRSAAIKDENGEVIFEQEDCEIPANWSQLATNIVVSKYFYGELGTEERESSVRQVIHRVSRTIADWGVEDGYFASAEDGERFYRELTWLCLHQHGAFNSPVWFNIGLYHQYGVRGDKCNWHWNEEAERVEQPENPYEFPQASACFIQRVEDNMEDIMRLATSEAMLFKFGSGTGTDLSTLRSHKEKLSGGGRPSGPLSFMRVYDQIAAVVKSGGKTRRAAKMQSLKVWHPDILDFIECKWKEEQKAHTLIASGNYEANFNGEAYSSVLFQNANLSVRVTDDYMEAVEKGGQWNTRFVTGSGRDGAPSYEARWLLNRMADCAWHCGDPGVQYDTTINRWNTCPNSGEINASNPCVTGDTLVATEHGLQRIDSLVDENPVVLGSDGTFRRASRVWKTGIKEVFKLRTERGYEITVTGDHRIATSRGDIPADQLRRGDRIRLMAVPFGERVVSEYEAKEVADHLTRISKPVHFHSGDSNIATAANPVTELFELDFKSAASVVLHYFEANEVLHDLGDPDFGVAIEGAPEVLRSLQLLLLGFGIRSAQFCPRALMIIELSSEQFVKTLQKDEPPTGVSLQPDRFSSLEPIGVAEVYDIAVPTDEHFVANGIVVHNCSEYMFLDDTACNLSSINLMKFRRQDGSFDVQRFKAACRIYFIAQEILVDRASYPTDRIAMNSHLYRPLGLGYANLGSLIMTSGLAYDSDAARGLCGSITALLHGTGNLTSAELAAAVGPFERYADNRAPFMNVMQMHRDAVEQIDDAGPEYLKDAARDLWEQVLAAGRQQGFRNAQATVLAPTGTISFMMDCDTTGIEPDIALVKYKQLAGRGMLKIVNRIVPLALESLGYGRPQVESITRYIDEHDTIEGSPDLDPDHLPVFDCAFKPENGVRSIPWQAHVRMMAAAQPFLSGAISKTVNMPSDVTPDDIADAYLWGWKMGLKALAIYRDGSKQSQPLSTKTEGGKDKAETEKAVAKPKRERLPDTRDSVTHKFNVAGHEGYITVGLYPDGRPGELFIVMAKEGSTVGGLMDCFGTAISMSLQYGVPLEVLVNKFSHTRFEPMGHTMNPDVRIAKSVVDYIFRWLGITFLPGYREADSGLPAKQPESEAGDDEASAAGPAVTKTGGQNGQRTAKQASKNGKGKADVDAAVLERAGVALMVDANGAPADSRSEQFARFQSDAPSCDNCGAITVRNGNCYLCHNCGNSMGCS